MDATIYYPGGYMPYRNAVYLVGAQFYQELRDTIGNEAFLNAFKQYAINNTYQVATRQTLLDEIARQSDADIKPLLQKYFQNP